MKVAEAVQSSVSLAGALRRLGRAVVGTNYKWLKHQVETLGLDTSHWRGKCHGTSAVRKYTAQDLAADSLPRHVVKKVVLREKLLPYVCAECGAPPEWRGRPLVLRLDHINGCNSDHRLKNLRFVCPNCDSQSSTFCGRNLPRREPVYCPCGSQVSPGAARCHHCENKRPRRHDPKIVWPSRDELLERLKTTPFTTLAAELGVSDNAIRKHLRRTPGGSRTHDA